MKSPPSSRMNRKQSGSRAWIGSSASCIREAGDAETAPVGGASGEAKAAENDGTSGGVPALAPGRSDLHGFQPDLISLGTESTVTSEMQTHLPLTRICKTAGLL